MTRKDFELIAASIARSRMAKSLIGNAKERTAALQGVQLVAIDLAASIAAQNSAFDRPRFLKACGFESQDDRGAPGRREMGS